jgi:hypothetical protein
MQEEHMRREVRESLLQREFVLHSKAFMMEFVEQDELIRRVCDAMDEQDARDTATSAPIVTDVLLTDTTPTDFLNIFEYGWEICRRIGVTGPFGLLGRSWASALARFSACGDRDDLIRLLHDQLDIHETRAEELRVAAHSLGSADLERGTEIVEANKVRAMLRQLGDNTV